MAYSDSEFIINTDSNMYTEGDDNLFSNDTNWEAFCAEFTGVDHGDTLFTYNQLNTRWGNVLDHFYKRQNISEWSKWTHADLPTTLPTPVQNKIDALNTAGSTPEDYVMFAINLDEGNSIIGTIVNNAGTDLYRQDWPNRPGSYIYSIQGGAPITNDSPFLISLKQSLRDFLEGTPTSANSYWNIQDGVDDLFWHYDSTNIIIYVGFEWKQYTARNTRVGTDGVTRHTFLETGYLNFTDRHYTGSRIDDTFNDIHLIWPQALRSGTDLTLRNTDNVCL